MYKVPSKIGPRTKREKEYSFEIGSIEEGDAIMELVGLKKIRTLQKNRESFCYNEVNVHVDTWPGIQTYLEVEGFDDVAIHNALLQLDIDPKGMTGKHAEDIFLENSVDPTWLKFSDAQRDELGI